jgi:hypothetical protein
MPLIGVLRGVFAEHLGVAGTWPVAHSPDEPVIDLTAAIHHVRFDRATFAIRKFFGHGFQVQRKGI